MFGSNSLPPLSPYSMTESSRASSSSNLNDVSMEEVDVSSTGLPIAPSFPSHGGISLPPRKGHRRSNSDLPLGFSAKLQSPPQLVSLSNQGRFGDLKESFAKDKLNPPKRQDMDMGSFRGGNSADVKSEFEIGDDLLDSLLDMLNVSGIDMEDAKLNGSEAVCSNSASFLSPPERNKRRAPGDIAPPARHQRSLSVDSAMMKYDFDDEFLKTPFATKLDHLSPGNDSNFDFGNGEFHPLELEKIVKDEKLVGIAISDPKRAKRILANRQSAARSKERKVRYISELEHKVQNLQAEATRMSSQVTILEKEYGDLTCQNNELRFRVQAMEQHAKLREALHSALTAEIQRLKLGNMQLREDSRLRNGVSGFYMQGQQQQQQQPGQMQGVPVSSPTTSTTPASACYKSGSVKWT